MTTKTIKQVTELLGIMNRGDDAHDLTIEVQKVLRACQEAGGPKTKAKGEVTLKLKFEVEGSYLRVMADITSKVPKVKRGESAYFLTQDGEITTEHPQQASFFDGPREVRGTA